MSGQDRVPKPPRNPMGRPLDPDQKPEGGPRHMKSRPVPGPDQWATYRLVSVAARLNDRRLNRRLARLGLTTGSLDALETAAELEPTTVTDLAELLCVSRQSMGKVLRRLQSLGFLKKEPARDGRSADICLTQQGRDVLSAAENLIREETASDSSSEKLLRRQLEEHIRHLRNAEGSTPVGHVGADRQTRAANGSGHRSERHLRDIHHQSPDPSTTRGT